MGRKVGNYILTKEQMESLAKDHEAKKYSIEILAEKYFISTATAWRYIKMVRI